MFIRQKNNQSGTVSVQIIDKSRGRYKVVKTIGSSSVPSELDRLNIQAKSELMRLTPQLDINYLKLEGEVSISIDYGKFNDDSKWDGLKGYQTNTKFDKDQVIAQYGKLFLIEKRFGFPNLTCESGLFFTDLEIV